jgi:hypothetical protein
LSDLWEALHKAYNSVDGVTENFVEDFAQPPEQKDLRKYNIVIDVLGMGLSMVMAPVFNNSKLHTANFAFFISKHAFFRTPGVII